MKTEYAQQVIDRCNALLLCNTRADDEKYQFRHTFNCGHESVSYDFDEDSDIGELTWFNDDNDIAAIGVIDWSHDSDFIEYRDMLKVFASPNGQEHVSDSMFVGVDANAVTELVLYWDACVESAIAFVDHKMWSEEKNLSK